jgi:hypothetical protein
MPRAATKIGGCASTNFGHFFSDEKNAYHGSIDGPVSGSVIRQCNINETRSTPKLIQVSPPAFRGRDLGRVAIFWRALSGRSYTDSRGRITEL